MHKFLLFLVALKGKLAHGTRIIEEVDDFDSNTKEIYNRACADQSLRTSRPIKSTSMFLGDKIYEVEVMFDSPHAKIWLVRNFITESECDAMERFARPKLSRALVGTSNGTIQVSKHRKAQTALYPDIHNSTSDPLWDLYRRTLVATSKHTNFKLKPHRQEEFNIIQYNVDDQYTPHCDGACDGSEYIPGSRVATSVMYCKVAEQGGGTLFPKANIFVKPEPGMATFFSYRGLDNIMDDGLTLHAGCPVLKGEKWITTLWMRDTQMTRDETFHLDIDYFGTVVISVTLIIIGVTFFVFDLLTSKR